MLQKLDEKALVDDAFQAAAHNIIHEIANELCNGDTSSGSKKRFLESMICDEGNFVVSSHNSIGDSPLSKKRTVKQTISTEQVLIDVPISFQSGSTRKVVRKFKSVKTWYEC